MLELFKRDKFLKVYLSLSLNDRIKLKYQEFRAFANCTYTDFGESYLCELLPKIDRIDKK